MKKQNNATYLRLTLLGFIVFVLFSSYIGLTFWMFSILARA